MSTPFIVADIGAWLAGFPLLVALGAAAKEIAQHWFLFFGLFGVLILGMWGLIGTGLGLHNVFHDDIDMIETHYRRLGEGNPSLISRWGVYRNSAALFSQLALAVFIALIWGFAYTLGPDDRVAGGEVASLWKGVGPHILVTTAIALAIAIFAPKPPGSAPRYEWLRAIIGAGVGLCFAAALFAGAQEAVALFGESYANRPTYALAVSAGFVILFVISLKRLLPSVALINLFAGLAVVYALLATLPDPSYLGTFVLIAFVLVATNGGLVRRRPQRLKFDFEGIAAEEGKDPYLSENRVKLDALPPKPPREQFVSPIGALENWRGAVGEKPKLVLVATSGGAYRASFWTALVLDELVRREREGKIPQFSRNVRLITGASGGMVAAAYFAAMMEPGASYPTSVLNQLEEDIFFTQDRTNWEQTDFAYPSEFPIPRDSLSPVAQQLVQRDVPGLFIPGRRSLDRGDVLERQWRTLNRSFESLTEGERAGWRPSLLFSPMIVETGQPLIISNLNLSQMLGHRGSEIALFFEWFPAAQKSFNISTAVRMNASFPYVSPATALPTEPPRRIVDAGYYDNYGIDMAVAYLSDPKVRDWVIEHTSGVAVIEIRAFPHAEPSDEDTSPFLSSFQWLTTPAEGMLSARGSTMTFRNRQSFRRLQGVYGLALKLSGDQETSGVDFLKLFPFELREKSISMNWYLPKHELEKMEAYLNDGDNPQSFAELESFW